jgi:hypothetical protein
MLKCIWLLLLSPNYRIFCILALPREKKSRLDPKKFLMSFLDPLFGVIAYGAEVTQLGAIGYGAEVRAALAQTDVVAPTWHRARRHRS